ncbi:hypothetical protein, partial [Pseudomonas sp. AF32]|uniref:hypothetical protein n=1 Tax=Pseudomonas sp. AF32 TaxID=554390 RepID=UPI001EEE3030
NRAFSPAHPFKSKHTSEPARDGVGSVNITVTDTSLSRAGSLPQGILCDRKNEYLFQYLQLANIYSIKSSPENNYSKGSTHA